MLGFWSQYGWFDRIAKDWGQCMKKFPLCQKKFNTDLTIIQHLDK